MHMTLSLFLPASVTTRMIFLPTPLHEKAQRKLTASSVFLNEGRLGGASGKGRGASAPTHHRTNYAFAVQCSAVPVRTVDRSCRGRRCPLPAQTAQTPSSTHHLPPVKSSMSPAGSGQSWHDLDPTARDFLMPVLKCQCICREPL